MRIALALLSALTAFTCGWLSVMYVLLAHDGWAGRAAVTALLVAHSVLTLLLAENFVEATWAWRAAIAGACLAIGFGYVGITSMLASSHFEGFWLPIGAALIAQGLLTLQNGLKGSFGLTWPWSS